MSGLSKLAIGLFTFDLLIPSSTHYLYFVIL
jgi:hypothetical protein